MLYMIVTHLIFEHVLKRLIWTAASSVLGATSVIFQDYYILVSSIHSQFFRKRITPQKSFTRMLKMALHVVASKGVKKNDVLFSGFFYLHRILSAPSTTCISLWHARPSLHIHEKLRKDFYWLASIPYHAIMLQMYAVSLHLC